LKCRMIMVKPVRHVTKSEDLKYVFRRSNRLFVNIMIFYSFMLRALRCDGIRMHSTGRGAYAIGMIYYIYIMS
jgi:hypothetical protein